MPLRAVRFPPRIRLAIALVALVAACRDATGPSAEPRLTMSLPVYFRGERVIVNVANEGSETIYCDHCYGELQGFEYPGEWVAGRASRACGTTGLEPYDPWWQLRTIEPGAAHADTFYTDDLRYGGTFRVVLGLRDAERRMLPEHRRVTELFEILE